MPAERHTLDGWNTGSATIGLPEDIRDTALRVGRNIRVNRPANKVATRPGSLQVTASVATGRVQRLWRRGDTVATTYMQIDSALYRLTAAWASAALIHSALPSEAISCANFIDGSSSETVHAYFVGTSFAKRDTGAVLGDIGVAQPSGDVEAATLLFGSLGGYTYPPSSEYFGPALSASLASDLVTTISTCDDKSDVWYFDGFDSEADDTTVHQEGISAIKLVLGAGNVGIARNGYSIDLGAFSLGSGDVSVDDYIHLWVRADYPERIAYMQIEFDIETATVGLFTRNYYSIRITGASLNQGVEQWTHLQLPKSSFQRFGDDSSLDWSTMASSRIVFANGDGSDAVTIWIDDFKMRGGTDVSGEVAYTAVFQNASTGAMGNPQTNANDVVIYSAPVTTDRQRINVDYSAIVSGAAGHPNDGETYNIRIYRRINNGESILIGTVADTDLGAGLNVFLDNITELETLLNHRLETNNDGIPDGAHFIFGPGSENRLFALVARNRCHYTKTWQLTYNRAENWPADFFFNVADGSELGMAGIATDTHLLVWTDIQTYEVRALGDDLYLPIPIPNSRGLVAKLAVAEGDGRIFFLASDGIYEHAGLTQRRITELITPFFAGETVAGVLPIEPTAAHLCQLQWYADPYAPMLVLLYPTLGSSVLDGELVIKRSLVTGLYSDISFDTHSPALSTVYAEEVLPTRLLAGDTTGRVVQIEALSADDDEGNAIDWSMRSRSMDLGAPQHDKRFDDLLIDADTQGEDVAVAVERNGDDTLISLGTFNTDAPQAQASFASLSEQILDAHHLAVEISGSTNVPTTIRRLSVTGEVLALDKIGWVSSIVTFRYLQVVRHLWVDVVAEAQVDVTLHCDGIVRALPPIMPAAGRQVLRLSAPGSTKGFGLQVRMTSTGFFRIEDVRIDVKPRGQHTGFQSVTLQQENP